MYQILCIDDSAVTQLVISKLLVPKHNFVKASSLAEARSKLSETSIDLILLDISLPDGDGLRFFSELKNHPTLHSIPVFVLSANQTLQEKTIGFQLGIDDYICKPFVPEELLLRIEAYLKKFAARTSAQNVFTIGDLRIDSLSQKINLQNELGNKLIELSTTEFKILTYLAKNKEHVKSREKIISFVWGESFNLTDRTVDSHISRIRKKIKDSDCQIEAVPNSGYRLKIVASESKKAA